MNAQERFRRVESLFRAAVGLPLAERGRFLERECPDETTVRLEVEGMLRADAEPSGALDSPALLDGARIETFLADRESGPDVDRPPPARIGGFEIIRRLGAGGMGVVYEARQENPRRTVALKVLHPGSVSRRSLQRFRHEAHVLARLQAPGIAQIFEAGLDDWGEGLQPFFAMEFVNGRPLLQYVREERLGPRERIALLAKICDAVHAAHQKGVVHRDLKPANILVIAEPDRDGRSRSGSAGGTDDIVAAQPKILDFGVARVLDPDQQSVLVESGVGQLLGTVAYMSPEQAAGDSAAIDIRSDVFSLGVIAFEMLSGQLPHEIRDRPLADALRIRATAPAPLLGSLDRSLRGDLETVIAKALELAPTRRFASAAEMAADLRRILRFEPIQARRPTLVDHLAKLARRNRALVVAGALALLGLIAATVLSLRLASVAEKARVDEAGLRTTADARAAEAEHRSYLLSIAASAASLRFHEVADARRQLDTAPVELRGWEWRHLRSRLDDSVARTDVGLVRHTVFAFSADGSDLLAATATGELRRWHVADILRLGEGAPVNEPEPISGSWRDRWIKAIRPDADGTLTLTTLAGFTRLDAASLSALQQGRLDGDVLATGAAGWIATAAPAVDGRRSLRIARADDALEFWPLASADAIARFNRESTRVAFADGEELGLTVAALPGGATLLHRSDLRKARAIAFSADDSRLAVATTDDRCVVLGIDGRSEVELRGHSAGVTAIAFRPDGALIATGSDDHTVRLWDPRTGECAAVMRGNEGRVSCLEFAPDGSLVATACEDGRIRLWRARDTADPFTLVTPAYVYSVAFAADGRLATASLGGDDPVRIWNPTTEAEQARLADGTASAVAWSPDGSRVAVGRSHGDITVYSLADDAAPLTIPGHHWRTDALEFSADGTQLFSIGNGGYLRCNDARTGERLRSKRVETASSELGNRLRLSPDRSVLALATGSEIQLLDPSTFEVRAKLSGSKGRICALAFAPDGRRLVTGGTDRAIRIWDLERGEAIATLRGHSASVYCVAVSPDGRRIASGGEDRVVRIWDAATFDELVALHGHSWYVYSLAFSPDGECLASGSGDATVRLWGTRPFAEVAAARP